MHARPARRLASAVTLAAIASGPASAQEWAGASPGLWTVPANWTPQAVPNGDGAHALIRTQAQGGALTSGGAFNITSPITLGSLTIDREVSGPALSFIGFPITFRNGNDPATLFTSGFLGLNITNAFVLQSDLHVDAQGPNGFVSGAISGPGGIIADSAYPSARLRLRGVNSYEGETIIRDSEITIVEASNLGAPTGGTTVEGAGQLNVESLANPTIDGEPLTILENGILWMRSGDWAGDIAISGGARISAFFDDEECEISGRISGTGPLTKSSAQSRITNDPTRESITTISNPLNDFTGGVVIHSGVLRVPADGALGDGAYGLLFNQTPGFFEGDGAFATSQTTTIARDVTMTTDGWLRAEAGTHATYTGPITGSSALTVGVEFVGDYDDYSGTIEFTGDNAYAGPTAVRSGTLLVSNTSGSATGAGDVSVLAGATLGGTGIIGGNVVVSELGAISPGASAGTLMVGGDVDLGPGSLDIELGGTGVGQFDQLLVGADVEAAGATLNVSLLPGYTPQDGDAFVIVLAAFVDGPFAMENLPEGFETDYSSSDRVVVMFAGDAPCPGDVTGDDVVDFSDLNALLVAFGESGMDLPADLDGSGTVDFPDLNQVLVFFGSDCL